MKIVLTGAAGFIGSCYLARLNEMGLDQVWIVDALKDPSVNGNLAGKKFLDYLHRDELMGCLDKGQFHHLDLIVHLGACTDTTETDRIFLNRNNTEYSQKLARWALSKGKRFHYASSASVYGDGSLGYKENQADLVKMKALNPYADSKLAFDRWVLNEKLGGKMVGFRYFNVFGPNEYHKGEMRSMVCKAFDQIKATGQAQLFGTTRKNYPDGSESRDFVYVKDAINVMLHFLEKPDMGGIFNVGTGEARSFKDLVSAVFAALGKKTEIQYVPMPEKLKGKYQYFTQADLSVLRKAGFQKPFMKLEDSVADYVRFYLSQPDRFL